MVLSVTIILCSVGRVRFHHTATVAPVHHVHNNLLSRLSIGDTDCHIPGLVSSGLVSFTQPPVVRWFLWGLLLAVTSGKLDFCIFPNLDNEKLGVIDSFKPLYSVKWKSKKKHRSSERDEKDDKKTK